MGGGPGYMGEYRGMEGGICRQRYAIKGIYDKIGKEWRNLWWPPGNQAPSTRDIIFLCILKDQAL